MTKNNTDNQWGGDTLVSFPGAIITSDDYPKLSSITPFHLAAVKRYAERAHESVRLQDGDDDETWQDRELLREEYVSIVNYSSSRAYANAAAMMMPTIFDQWHGVQFSDDTRMIAHAICHGYYRSLAVGNDQSYASMQAILGWCDKLGIKTSEGSLRLIVNNGIKEGMFERGPRVGNNKTYYPLTKMLDMYQSSSCLYAAMLGTRWLGLRAKNFDDTLKRLVEVNPEGVFQDVAIITRGVVRQFEAEGSDFIKVNKPLPRITLEQILDRA